MASTRCTVPVVDQLKDVLGTHPGTTEVRLRLMTKTSTTVMRLDDRLPGRGRPPPVGGQPRVVRRPKAAAGAALPGRLTSYDGSPRPPCRYPRRDDRRDDP